MVIPDEAQRRSGIVCRMERLFPSPLLGGNGGSLVQRSRIGFAVRDDHLNLVIPTPHTRRLNSAPRASIIAPMTIPNIITIGRLIIVPIVIVMIMQQRWVAAFVL